MENKNLGGRKAGAKEYNKTMVSIIEKHTAEGWGPSKIVKLYPALGFSVNGIKSAQKRIRANGGKAKSEEKRGRKKWKRTEDVVDKVNAQLRSSKGATVRKISSNLRREGIEVCRETVRRVLKKDLKKQSPRTVRGRC